MTNYAQIVQDEFYSKHPGLKKLEFGCEMCHSKEVESKEELAELYSIDMAHNYVYQYVGQTYGSNGCKYNALLTATQGKTRGYTDKGWVILGKPITTLQAISLLGSDCEMYVAETGDVYVWALGNGIQEGRFEVDPTLPLLRDQSEEVQKQLAELLGLMK